MSVANLEPFKRPRWKGRDSNKNLRDAKKESEGSESRSDVTLYPGCRTGILRPMKRSILFYIDKRPYH